MLRYKELACSCLFASLKVETMDESHCIRLIFFRDNGVKVGHHVVFEFGHSRSDKHQCFQIFSLQKQKTYTVVKDYSYICLYRELLNLLSVLIEPKKSRIIVVIDLMSSITMTSCSISTENYFNNSL